MLPWDAFQSPSKLNVIGLCHGGSLLLWQHPAWPHRAHQHPTDGEMSKGSSCTFAPYVCNGLHYHPNWPCFFCCPSSPPLFSNPLLVHNLKIHIIISIPLPVIPAVVIYYGPYLILPHPNVIVFPSLFFSSLSVGVYPFFFFFIVGGMLVCTVMGGFDVRFNYFQNTEIWNITSFLIYYNNILLSYCLKIIVLVPFIILDFGFWFIFNGLICIFSPFHHKSKPNTTNISTECCNVFYRKA